jgi:hypothetical protein
LEALPKGSEYSRDYFIHHQLPALNHFSTGNARLKVAPSLMVHVNNSVCHGVVKITEKMSLKRLGRALHSGYSPNINPCDFWAFRTIKGATKDRHFHGPEEILRAIQEASSHFIFEDFQNVFKSWMDRLTWPIAHNREYYH